MVRRDQLLRFLCVYYVCNAACIGLYFLLRRNIDWAAAPKRYLRDADHLLYWEKRTGWMLLALAAGRYFRRSTMDGYLSEVFGYIRVASITVLAAVDYRLGVCMALWVLLCALLFIQPRYSGQQNVDVLTPTSFESLAMSETGQSTWLVMLTAQWSSQSRQAQATFADLSLEYASDRLMLGELDVGRWPKMAKRFDMSIDTAPHQLPAFLLLKRGKLVKRLPEANQNWERKGRLKQLLIDHFDLDMVLASGLQQS